jgi:hypothetical protein
MNGCQPWRFLKEQPTAETAASGYMTELPKRELLGQKLHKAVELKRLEAKPV